MSVKQFILENWEKTYREKSPDGLPLPKPFTVPCINDGFQNFFYWDTYFTNVGLLLSGETEQAKNNLDNIAHLIETHGFMPNANHILDRSQPPLFARGVWEYYQFTGDESIPAHFVYAIEKELSFWKNRRNTKSGFYSYGYEEEGQAAGFFRAINPRVNMTVAQDKEEYEGKNLLAMAESGWDFTHRFATETSPVDICRFAPVDLNCILYEAEAICGKLFILIGNTEKGNAYLQASEARKTLIEQKMRNANGVYSDYDEKMERASSFISAASFLPFVCGISTDGEAFDKTLAALELPHGVSTTQPLENGYQWDFPNVWPPLTYFTVIAAENLGKTATAKRIAQKYLTAMDGMFKTTGKIWEKYDGRTGTIPERSEYGTPAMMGWTAGAYLYFAEKYPL
jgi:alpha,alpha-trehalase